ncbi:hypothetical protein RclHR1_09320002 [Rhizophagus clarus]|uniref:Uncharacterized protein n=1 Tax=Rhizophagus clarus TaxID=94130 RepID=A0A2Z6S6B5_9GLOM|nr:hypothetical protein RclHR1_09320002 [Rhizophagus clarus]
MLYITCTFELTKSITGLLKLRTIKCCQMKCCQAKNITRLLELRTIKVREVLPDEKHQTIRIKAREGWGDKKHDQTIGIKCCQMKSMTGLLELRIIKCFQTKNMTRLLKLRTIKCCETKSTRLLELSIARRKALDYWN